MRGFRKFSRLGNLFKQYFVLLNKDKSIVTILDENNNALANVAVQIKRGSYTYVDVTDSNGNIELMGTYALKYEVTLAKSGIEQKVISGWKFSSSSNLVYEQIAKTTQDGMYGGTDQRMYVDESDGGFSDNS